MYLFRPLLSASLLLAAAVSHAALTIPGADGSDGSLHITEDTTIDLGLATEGAPGADAWSADNSANAGNGIYDPDKWALVFKYTSVTVDAGATLSFTNHPSRAPVVWLVSGDVIIDGTMSLNGTTGAYPPGLAEPGPGGFRGGMAIHSPGVTSSSGFGPGGASGDNDEGYGGSYGAQGNGGPAPYGNPSLLPLLGGSGGGGDNDRASGGGAGGGALLVASVGTVTIGGTVSSNGGAAGSSSSYAFDGGGGSGGGLRVVADVLAGDGALSALAGTARTRPGSVGRIRLEYASNTSTIAATPDPSVVPLDPDSTALIWPPEDAPSAKILSIGGVTVGDDPRASFGTQTADAVIAEPGTGTTTVVVETVNVEAASEVFVRVTPRTNTKHQFITIPAENATQTSDPDVLHWTVDIPVNVGYSALQAKVIRP